jgi:hypothetical protein
MHTRSSAWRWRVILVPYCGDTVSLARHGNLTEIRYISIHVNARCTGEMWELPAAAASKEGLLRQSRVAAKAQLPTHTRRNYHVSVMVHRT